MPFNDFAFPIFLLLTLAAYRLLPARARPAFLAIASLWIYSFAGLDCLALLIFTTGFDFVAAILLETTKDPRARTALVTGSIGVNLAILGAFKYRGFLASPLAWLAAPAGSLETWLPVGISFYTFQSMAYVIDVYRGHIPAERSYPTFVAFVAFFPQLVAGPIERASHLLPQIRASVTAASTVLEPALALIAWGFFKKLVIADNMPPLVAAAFEPPPGTLTAGIALIGAYAFAIQIYADFSGYTDIARGTARLFGVELRLNFDRPYLATGPRDFWRRWHISLSEWFRDYLYVPLGGSRGTAALRAACVLITMTVAGFWHGAALNFILWGLYHGVLILLERGIGGRGPPSPVPTWPRLFLQRLVTFHLVCFGWVLFRAADLGSVLEWLWALTLLEWDGRHTELARQLVILVTPLLLAWWRPRSAAGGDDPYPALGPLARPLYLVALYFALTVLAADEARTFLYFRF